MYQYKTLANKGKGCLNRVADYEERVGYAHSFVQCYQYLLLEYTISYLSMQGIRIK
jgi:hypothetical protein